MPRMKRTEVEAIIKRDLPGKRVVRKARTDAKRTTAAAASEELDTLYRRFGITPPTTEETPNGAVAVDDDEIVAVEDEERIDAFSRASRPKTVIISGATKKVVGSQG